MIKRDESKVYNFPEGSLSSFSDYGLTIPFANMTSTMRQHMWHSHLRQLIIPIKAERPLIDTRYTKDIMFSTDNKLIKSKITLVDKIEKVINNYLCETTYIYYDHQRGEYFIESVPRYTKYAKYAYETHSEFEDYKIGETRENTYIRYIDSMDKRDGGVAFGKNIICIYDIDKNVGEDSIIMCQELADQLAVNTYYNPEITFNPNEEILLDRYGKMDNNGITHYKPFPLPGEDVINGEVDVISKMANDFLASSDDIVHNSDIAHYVLNGTVTDVEVYSNYKLENEFLEELRQAHMDYLKNIVLALNKLSIEKLSLQAKNHLSKLSTIITSKLRFGTEELNRLVKIRLKIVGRTTIKDGFKITNRYGGKGTVSQILVVPEPFYAEDGTKIMMKINASGVSNRENISQLMEQSLSSLNMFLQKYLIESDDPLEVKYDNIMTWIVEAKLYDLVKTFEKYSKEDVVSYVRDNLLHMKYDPFDKEINKLMLFELTKFTLKIYPKMAPMKIYENGHELGDKFFYGNVFCVVLENNPNKDTSMRSDRINSAKGGLSRVGLDKKKYHSKYLTTAVKQSDLAQNVAIASQFDSDRSLLSPDLSQLTRSLNAIGLDISVRDIPEEGDD